MLVVAGYVFLGRRLWWDADVPLAWVLETLYPWALAALIVAAGASWLFSRGYRRLGLILAAFAAASSVGWAAILRIILA